MGRLNSERGIALAVAIFALVVIGALIAGSMFVATQEQRIGRNTLRQEAAFTAAEAGVQDALLHWSGNNANRYDTTQIGGSVTTYGTAPDGQGWYRRSIQRLGDMMFLVQSDGYTRDSLARAGVALLVRLRPLQFNITAALKSQGIVRVGGASDISGADSVPKGWTDCPPTQPMLPGISVSPTSSIDPAGCKPSGGDYPCITGSPDVYTDTTISDSSLTTVGDISFDSLLSYANKIIPGGNIPSPAPTLDASGACNTSDQYNWGDPENPSFPCGGYFPIIWSQTSMSVQNGFGQGVLIVNGDLKVTGTFAFYGPVLVKGTLSTQGTGAHFNGGVIAAATDLSADTTSAILGNAVINYSSCAVLKALKATATASPFRQRAWLNSY